jgi:enterochelin esterase-like enzyme
MSTGNLPEDMAVESSMDKLAAKQFSSHTFLDGVISLAGVASPNRRSSMRANSVCPAFLLILLLGGIGWAQMTMVPQATAAPSPVVQADGTVSFHLLAPTASSVSLDADYPISPSGYGNTRKQLPLTKDDKGDWSLTVGPLKPEFYGYSFLVDGARVPDPQNVRMTRDGLRYLNWAVVTGPGSANYEFNDLPHGQIAKVWYPSPTLQLTRRMLVYTPPGYETGNARYPVLYLIHGGGGDEEAWTDMGRAPEIFDNLLAQGKMVPMIVVMGNGNEWQSLSPNDKPVPNPPGTPSGKILMFPDSLVHDIVPFVDGHYRTKTGREYRAIAGLSRGGAQALYAAMNNLNDFAWLGVFSGGLPLLPNMAVNIPRPADADTRRGPDVGRSIDPEKFKALLPTLGPEVNSQLRLLYLTIGTDDGLVESWKDARKVFDEKGVKYTWIELPGYGHEWSFWRLALQDFTPRLFRAGT